jgi:very-short-patch-repair endonuclease
MTPDPKEPLELRRCRQLFEFLKAFAQRNEPTVRKLADQRWTLRIRDLPKHESIAVGEVRAGAGADAGSDDTVDDAPLIRVRRPKLTNAPPPPDLLQGYVLDRWKDPDGAAEVQQTRVMERAGEIETEHFADSPARVNALADWRTRWRAWAEKEKPAVAAMRVFERLYELRGRIERESEQVELLLGDGRLRWQAPAGALDHPVLLQRVDLEFDADIPEFRVFDADRGPELYSSILMDGTSLDPAKLNTLRTELERGEYHPLASNGTSGYLTYLVQLLGPRGALSEEDATTAIGPDPAMARDPVLFLRKRAAGFAAAFDRVLENLDVTGAVPRSLGQVVGVHKPITDMIEHQDGSPWGEPDDVLLSKLANAEQIQVVRALERHKAIVVQGPPGTGKSHTIANLIGHLVAHGKRVLVTSHTTKALRVLREQIVESLQPLCVAVLENDLEGKKQMENAVRGILSRLTSASDVSLKREVDGLTKDRAALNARIGQTTTDLRAVRESEYVPIVIAGESVDPAQASRWVREHQHGNDWIPGPVAAGAPLPLSDSELHELYATNAQLSTSEEAELAAGLPLPETLPDPAGFGRMVAALSATEADGLGLFWERAAVEPELPLLEGLRGNAVMLSDEVAAMAPWQKTLLAAGYEGGAEADLWKDLALQVEKGVAVWERSRALLMENDVTISEALRCPETSATATEIGTHLANDGGLSWPNLLFKPKWKAVLDGCTVNGKPPRSTSHFRAIVEQLTLDQSRQTLRRRWEKQAEPAGLPAFDSMGSAPEQRLPTYSGQFGDLLSWFSAKRDDLEKHATSAGFRLKAFGQREVARSAPASAFELECQVIGGPLRTALDSRTAVALKDQAVRELAEAERALVANAGELCKSLRAAVRNGDVAAYEAVSDSLRQLRAKRKIWERRQDLLARLESAAAGWARTMRQRTGEGSRASASGDFQVAWRWRQLAQEIDRRAALDEHELKRRLETDGKQLRGVTADLIDRMAWREQLRRTDGHARQALQGWADTQKKLGRGTGKRAPQLRAELRKLLAKAQNAVPVWIMPLARVAEGIDAVASRFDVVVVDEASQSDVMGLLAWYLGDQLAIVGDHEQVSPLGVGQNLDSIQKLINQYLDGIPNSHLYDGSTSVYDLARQSFGGTIAQREHFRCVPAIIEFSNELCYNFEIRPLRDPSDVQRPFVAQFVVNGPAAYGRMGKTNQLEAYWVVSLIEAMTMMSEYDGKSFGAITLLGDEQASLIQDLAAHHIGAVELDRRRFAAGNSAQFQGDERHVMVLTMVDTPTGGPLPMRQTPAFKQRYNVAASRAKDQLWLVHSLDPNRDLREGDLRRRLIEYVRDPGAQRRALDRAKAEAESPFELEVLKRLIAAGYRVEPQVWVGGYRIDMVVSDATHQVAIECDGEKFHGVDKIPDDMARQAVLERAGWRFVRIRGSRYFRDPDATMQWVFEALTRLDVNPYRSDTGVTAAGALDDEFKQRVVRSAWEIMQARGWLPDTPTDDSGPAEAR